ncbi:MAG: radical SAM protein [Acidobacteria bacterium]|uniref:Radical SAM protein n=1 Tax=Candidatus Polarisedimenticola svalbardensis TaxID=2886004 RepID=A0A8J7CDC0_9BACT|nr:radical SAM protein [Candidatus Polarisedimenticola svalbardensis]
MKVLLIAPASGNWHHVGQQRIFGGKTFRFSLLSLLSLAAETPPGFEIRIVDEQVQDVPWNEHFDLVGITCMTAAAPRAYDIADHFRTCGVPVVLGGMHPTFLPDEALQHADAVCVGEAEGVWRHILEDARHGKVSGIYRADEQHTLVGLHMPPRALLDARRYGTIQSVQATRGCPNRCSFCSVSAFHKGSLRCRPVEEVVCEVKDLSGRFFMFVDDSLTAERGYALELCQALKPLGKIWISQSTLEMADDEELVQAASEAGCIGMFVGLESFSESSLRSVDKGFNRVAEYRDRIATLHANGIGVEAGIVFGFDTDGPNVFRSTLELLDEIGIDAIQVSVLTPLPGTPMFDRLVSRISEHDWSRYDYHHVVFRPARMTAEQLQAGHDWVTREFYRPWRIARRLARMALRPGGMRMMKYAAALNAAYYGRTVRWDIRGYDPGVRSRTHAHGGDVSRLPSLGG